MYQYFKKKVWEVYDNIFIRWLTTWPSTWNDQQSREIYLDPYEGLLGLKQCNLQLSLQRTPVFIKDTCASIGTRLSFHVSCYILISNELQLATLATVHTCHHLNIPGAPVGTKLLCHASWYIMISFTNTEPTVTRVSPFKVQKPSSPSVSA